MSTQSQIIQSADLFVRQSTLKTLDIPKFNNYKQYFWYTILKKKMLIISQNDLITTGNKLIVFKIFD